MKSQFIAPVETFDDPKVVAAMITSFPMTYDQSLTSFVRTHNADCGFEADRISEDEVRASYQLSDQACAHHAAMLADYVYFMKGQLTIVR
jgi:hypothetical protein